MTNYYLKGEAGAYAFQGNAAEALIGIALDPARPFYKFVVTYVAASAGFTPVYDQEHYRELLCNTAGVFPGAALPAINFDLGGCVRDVRAGALHQRDAEISLCSMLIIAASASIQGEDFAHVESHPTWQFFRHVRNAAAHGNRWHFNSERSVDRTEWRGFVIEACAKGTPHPLHGQHCIYGPWMWPAELIFLLRDVEELLARNGDSHAVS